MLHTLFLTLFAATAPSAPRYDCPIASDAPVIDGKLDDAAWKTTPWTADFADIEGSDRTAPPLRTRAKLAADARCLYIAAELSETHVWAAPHQRDEPLFRENAFEVFLDAGGDGLNYVELQISADNTICDLRMNKPYSNRGRADVAWNIEGLKSAVHVDGTLNDPADRDTGWTIELAIPWAALADRPPRAGETWRVNLARVQHETSVIDGRYEKLPKARPRYATWSPQGEINMHIPQRWGHVRFGSTAPQNKPEHGAHLTVP
jgi:hypothetical protein